MKILTVFPRESDASERGVSSGGSIFPDGVMAAGAGTAKRDTPPQANWEALVASKLSWSPYSALTILTTHEAFNNSTWVRRAVWSNALKIAKLPLAAYKGETDTKHPTLDLLNHPTPWMSGFEFWMVAVMILEIYGESFWLKEGEVLGRDAKALYPLHPKAMKERVSEDGKELLGWTLQTPRGQRVLDRDQVLQYKYPNPFNPWRGLSKLDVALYPATTDVMQQRWNGSFFANGAKPAGALASKDVLQSHQVRQILGDFEERHKSPHRVAFLNGIEWVETQANLKDVDFINGRKANREEILSALGTPPFEVGLPIDTTQFDSVRFQVRHYWHATLLPIIALLRDANQRDLIKDESITIEHDTDGIEELSETLKEKLETADKLLSRGMPFKAVNKMLEMGAPSYDGDDVGLVPSNLVPLRDLLEPPQPQPAELNPQNPQNPQIGPDGKPIDQKPEEQQNPGGQQPPPKNEPPKPNDNAPQKKTLVVADGLRTDLERALSIIAKRDENDALLGWLTKALEDLKGQLQARSRAPLTQGMQLGMDQMAELLNVDLETSMEDPKAQEILRQKLLNIAGVDDTIKERLREQMIEGVAAGEGHDLLAERVKGVFNIASSRARSIAITEVGQAVSAGRFLTLKDESVDQHEWLSARDERVRESHAEEDGHVVPVGQPFPVTGLVYPSQIDGPAKEIIKCRCITLPANYARGFDRDAYWWRTVKRAEPIERRLEKIVRSHFYNQRSRVLAALAKNATK